MDTNVLEEFASSIIRVEVCSYRNWLSYMRVNQKVKAISR
jgi:hypothetical protein